MINNHTEERTKALQAAGVSEHSGFPNPATDRSLNGLDLNQLLIKHRTATYLMSIQGGSWEHLGIYNNDIVVIDRAQGAKQNDLVIWWAEDSFTIGHAHKTPNEVPVWGVITATIHIRKT